MPDLSNLFNFQLAIIGIVLVAGLFYLWRLIARVESRIDELALAFQHINANQSAMRSMSGSEMPGPIHITPTTTDQEAEEFMNEVFGSGNNEPMFIPSFATLVTSQQQPQEDAPSSSVQIEEIQSSPNAPPSSVTEDAPLTKTKLQKLPLDALKKIAREKLLSSEGTRADLIKRILSTMDVSDTQE